MKSLELKVRATNPGTDQQNLKFASRVYISRDAVIELTNGVEDGKPITIERISDDGQPAERREATLWAAPTKLVKVAQISEAFRTICGYSIGDRIKISFSAGSTVPDAEEIVLRDITSKDGAAPPLETGLWERFWEEAVARNLVLIENIFPGMTLKKPQVPPPSRVFTVVSVNGSPTTLAKYVYGKTILKIGGDEAPVANAVDTRKLEIDDIPGREPQVKELNDFLRCFAPSLTYKRPDLLASGLIIHGTHGTGKTMLLDRIAKTGWGTVHQIQFKDKLSDIQETLTRARTQQPSIVLIDMLERLIDKDRNNRTAVILALCEALDRLAEDSRTKGELPRVVVIGTFLDYTEFPADLREPGRFDQDIYLPLPDVPCRRAILSSYNLHFVPEEQEEVLKDLSERTHAYNAKDLQHLVREIMRQAEKLTFADRSAPDESTADEEQPGPYIPLEVVDQALRKVRPSAMRDINLNPPPVRWDDIGGQASVKASLQQAVALSTAPKELLSSFFEHPPKGFLLYGPPGCSKTMAAQAMATESGLNFFAVKGAELLNMYVGESERAVRQLFERAREASPSMIFFDEIDAIAGHRHGFGFGGGKSSTSHGGHNVLTTLLNEMDGFEATQGVLVLAATNRPQALDPALLRPGRFDDLIYVGPPDLAAREAIFRNVARKHTFLNVDIPHLAAMTEGYSGAEIKGACATAGRAALGRYQQDPSAAALGITMEDLETAVASHRQQITEEMLSGYTEWESQFRGY